MEVRLMRAEDQIAKVTAQVDAVLSGHPVQAAAPEKPPMPELQELSLQFEQFKQTKEAEEKALKAEIKKLQEEIQRLKSLNKHRDDVINQIENQNKSLRDTETQLKLT
jgi:predicted RNase H-like nuclease (RuvC/YqgF family)